MVDDPAGRQRVASQVDWEWEELVAILDTIKLLNDYSFKHSLLETSQVGEQLTSENLGPGTLRDIQVVTRKPVETQPGIHELHEQNKFG